MKKLRHLTFEIDTRCNMSKLHPKCPINDPQRYLHSPTTAKLTDEFIFHFWQWCRRKDFNGIIMWHMYNEPTLDFDRIEGLMRRMKGLVPDQKFLLWTNSREHHERFDLVRFSNYHVIKPEMLDDRLLSVAGEGYYPGYGARCLRTCDWEVIIDAHGNWLQCCNDWRNELSHGNPLINSDWESIYRSYKSMSYLEWKNLEEWNMLPRLCRACVTVNPLLALYPEMRPL